MSGNPLISSNNVVSGTGLDLGSPSVVLASPTIAPEGCERSFGFAVHDRLEEPKVLGCAGSAAL